MRSKKTRQIMFFQLGYYDGKFDGIWGKKSKKATLEFQKDNGLKEDSIYGPKTERKLNQVYKKFMTGNATEEDFIKTDYFKVDEIACNDRCGYKTIKKQLLYNLYALRYHFNQPIYISSGCRCEKHNKRVGGAKTSRHFNKEKGTKAIDFYNNKTKKLSYRKKVIDFWINYIPNSRYGYCNNYSNLNGVKRKKKVSTMGNSIHLDIK